MNDGVDGESSQNNEDVGTGVDVTDTSRYITWGEFLLLLLPHARISYFSEYGGKLNNTEYMNIHTKKHILGDESWGMVPLQIKEDRYYNQSCMSY